MMKSKEYKKGYIDGYKKGLEDYRKIRKEINKKAKPLENTIKKIRERLNLL